MTGLQKNRKISNRAGDLISRNRYPIFAFAVSFLALLVYAIARGLAPFGDGSFLSMDLWGQYYPMIVESIENPFSAWSWSGALGYQALVQNAYYTNSIFNFLLLPFSSYARISALDFLLIGKLSLASAVFAYYLEKRRGEASLLTAALGVAYGLSAYMTAYIAQPMWLDLAIFVPLILLGLEKLLMGGKPWLYVGMLALAIYSNFYIGFAVCIFTGLWFVATILTDGKKRNAKLFLRDTGKFALFSVVAAALAGFVLIPLYFGMQTWISSSIAFDRGFAIYHSISEIVDNLTVGAKSSWEYGVANLYCGAAVFFFFSLFLMNRNISLRKKIVFTIFAVFMLLSFELSYLDFLWHGFHFPNQLPGRQSFLYVFLMLTLAYEALSRADGLSGWKVAVGALLSASVFFVGIKDSKDILLRLISAGIVILFAVVILISFAVQRGCAHRVMPSLLAVLILTEALSSGIYVLARYGRSTDSYAYVKFDEDMANLTEKYESGKDTFYRTEMTGNQTFDPAMLYGFSGITYYSSTMNGEIYRMMERLGNRVYAKNVSTIYQPTPIQDLLFDVKYHYATNKNLIAYADEVEKTKTITVLESPYAIGLAFAADKDIKEFSSVGLKPMEAQGDLIGYAAGLKNTAIVQEAFIGVLSQENARFFTSSGKQYYSASDPESTSRVLYTFQPTTDGLFYLDFDYTVGNYTVYVNGKKAATGECGRNPLCGVGYIHTEDPIEVEITTKGYATVLAGVSGYTISEKLLNTAKERLSASVLDIEKATDTKIKGTIVAEKDCVLYSSIPANVGWNIYIDGEKAEPFAVDGALLACELPAGEHEVIYRYRTPGLGLGLAVSALGMMSLIGYAFYERKKTDRVS